MIDNVPLFTPAGTLARSWWLEDSPDVDAEAAFAPIEAFQEELRAASPDAVRTFARFALHGGLIVLHELAD